MVGKKLLLLPNFDQFNHGVVETLDDSPSAASRALSMVVDCFPPNCFIPRFEDVEIRFWYVLVIGKKKTADDARFSPTAWPTCPPSCSNNPEEATSKCQALRMRPAKAHSKEFTGRWRQHVAAPMINLGLDFTSNVATTWAHRTVKGSLNVFLCFSKYFLFQWYACGSRCS